MASGPVFMFCGPNSFSVVQRSSGPVFMFCAPNSFSALPRAPGPVFKICALRLIFDGNDGVGSRFHVLRFRTHFRRYLGRRISFSCFVCPDSFSTVPKASGPVFMFLGPRLVFGATEGVGSRFHVLRTHNRFRRAECVESHFHVLRSWTRFRRCRVRRVPFSCFTRPASFSTVLIASGLVFMFCASGLVLVGTEGVWSRFLVLCSRASFRWYRGRRVSF
jgi:hypothetical protein